MTKKEPDYKFNKKHFSRGDQSLLYLEKVANAIRSCPGIRDVQFALYGNETKKSCIFFKVDGESNGEKGLFFIARSLDRRYWDCGHEWKLEINVGDVYTSGILPITYCLGNEDYITEVNLNLQLKSMLDKMNYNLNHRGFMRNYKISIDDFDLLPNKIVLIEKL